MDIDYASIGKRIKDERKRQKFTQEKLAEMADISIPYLSNIENANTSVGLNVLFSIANALHVSLDELCCDNLSSSGKIYTNKIADLVQDCSNYELQVIERVIRELIDALRDCKNTHELRR